MNTLQRSAVASHADLSETAMEALLWEIGGTCMADAAEERDRWEAIAAIVEQAPSGARLLKDFNATLTAHVNDIIRVAYYRGYHAGYRDSTNEALPLMSGDG